MQDHFITNWAKHTMIVVTILILWQIGAFAFRQMARSNGQQILAPITKNAPIQIIGMKNLSSFNNINLAKLMRLYSRVYAQKEQHKQAFLKFYPYHFASSALLLILSSLSVVLVFLTSQVGLKNTHPYIQTGFFTLAALTSFYALSPLVFKQESNISANLSKYVAYDNLGSEIYHYAITQPHVTSTNDTLTLNEFHGLITQKIADINGINVEFDYKAIPIQEFLKTKKQP